MPDSRLHRLLLAIAGVGLLYFLWRSIAETWDLCDFEVFWATAVRVLDGKVDFYEVPSPVKLRNFFYPPSAAVLLAPLAPLGLVSQPVAGVVWSLLKTAALALLLRVGVDAARARPTIRLGLCLITALLAIRPITSDFGNGQINILVAALAALGCLGLMSARRGRVVAGAFALATAVALKATPGLLLIFPLLQRRWRAAMGGGVATVLLVVALPAVTFGPSTTLDLFRRFEQGSSQDPAEDAGPR